MKDEIIEIAIRQMKRGGYDNLNFADIADELKTSRANLHHHFKNKEGLAVAATERYIRDQKQRMDEILCNNDDDIVTVLKKIEAYLIETYTESGAWNACVCGQLIQEREAPEVLRQLALSRFQDEEKDIEAQFRQSKKDGELTNSSDVKNLTFKVVTAMHGIGQMALIEPNKTKLAKNIKGSLTSILA